MSEVVREGRLMREQRPPLDRQPIPGEQPVLGGQPMRGGRLLPDGQPIQGGQPIPGGPSVLGGQSGLGGQPVLGERLLLDGQLMQDGQPVRDGRLVRGAQSRRTIVRHAVDVASLAGLDGLSFGRLAADLGISKGGIQTLFGAKETLQLAVAEAAREAFEDAVIAPALAQPPGTARLHALIDRWIDYAAQPLFAGGCFWAANLPVFDSHPGPVRDILARQQRSWRNLIAVEVRHAADAAELTVVDADLVAFQIDAVLTSTNTALRLGEPNAVAMARRAIAGLVAPPA